MNIRLFLLSMLILGGISQETTCMLSRIKYALPRAMSGIKLNAVRQLSYMPRQDFDPRIRQKPSLLSSFSSNPLITARLACAKFLFGHTLGRALFDAIYENNMVALKTILALGVDPNQFRLMMNFPLHVAIGQGNLEAVKLLINAGANLEEKNNIRYTPLQSAVTGYFDSRVEVVYCLLAAGADRNAITQRGKNAFDLVARQKFEAENLVPGYSVTSLQEKLEINNELSAILELLEGDPTRYEKAREKMEEEETAKAYEEINNRMAGQYHLNRRLFLP